MPSGLLKGSDMRTLSAALAALTLGLAGTAMAQEAVSPSSFATAGLSRAEVLADLEMWHQAGRTQAGVSRVLLLLGLDQCPLRVLLLVSAHDVEAPFAWTLAANRRNAICRR